MLSGKQTAFVNPSKSRIVAKLIDLLASDYPAPPDRHAAEKAAAYTKIYKYKCHLCWIWKFLKLKIYLQTKIMLYIALYLNVCFIFI